MDRPEKARLRRQWAALRDLWNGFDPIGVMGDPSWPRDEYESCVGGTLRRLREGASVGEIADYLDAVVNETMKLNLPRRETERFARRLVAWFKGTWEG